MSEADLAALLPDGEAARTLAAVLAAGPDPDAARERTIAMLHAARDLDGPRLAEAAEKSPEGLAAVGRGLAGIAPFFTPFVERHPSWLLELLEDDLRVARTPHELARRLDRHLEGVAVAEIPAALRRFKYRELARITVRDCTPDWVPEERVGETLAEVSHLADALLARALAAAEEELRAEASLLPFCVLGLGKLGSEELNFSSDVDLVYVFERPESASQADPDAAEFFTRLARRFGAIVGETGPDGFLYRIDLDLRPEGTQGPLAISDQGLVDYFDGRAATWEKAAYMKARPVAGDIDFGWRVIRSLDPIVYRSSIDFAGVASIREMKQRVEAAKGAVRGGFDVKLGRGGIRDLEFVAQALQLLHGGRIPQVRNPSTQGALQDLAAAGVMDEAVVDDLLGSYRFLRRLENRLQMERERQTHRMPEAAAARERLARSLDLPDAAALAKVLDDHCARVRKVFEALLHPGDDERVLELFSRHVPRLLVDPTTRLLIENLARRFAREVSGSASPERAMNNLDRFIEGIGGHTFYHGLLIDRPELVSRLCAVFGASNYLSHLIASRPELIEPVFEDPSTLVPTREQLGEHFASIRASLDTLGEVEADLCALRRFVHREVVNVGLLDLGEKVEIAEAEGALSDVAEFCLERALEIARAQLAPRATPACSDVGFLVVGMGKLASRELSYGSDLDVIFLYDRGAAEGPEASELQEYSVRLGQRLISVVQTPTADGSCYEVDSRLRPSGRQGMLVTSLAAFEDYHERSAMVWERQALLRARAVAGDPTLRDRYEALRRDILARPLAGDLAEEIHRIRRRTETELAREEGGRRDVKLGRGGQLEAETVVQFLQLRHGAAQPELQDVAPLAVQIDRLLRVGLLSAGHAERLAEGWHFLKMLASRLRIVENRSISQLDEERGELDAIARAMGYPATRGSGGARGRMLADYRRHTDAVRAVYLEVLGIDPEASVE